MRYLANLSVWSKVIIGFAVCGILFTALMGFAHTKAGRPVLVLLGKMMGKKEFCPLGYDQHATLAQREETRKLTAANYAKLPKSRATTALDFELGKSTRGEVANWVQANHGTCRAMPARYETECVGGFFGSFDSTLWLEFDRADSLVSIRAITKFKEWPKAMALYGDVRSHLRAEPRTSYKENGDPVKTVAEGGLLAQSSVEARYQNFTALARLTKMADGYAVSHDFSTF